MESKYYKLEIITTHGVIFSDNVVQTKLPGMNGKFGILVNHIPYIALLKCGIVEVNGIGSNYKFTTSSGYAHILDNVLKIVTESAENIEKIDFERAKKARDRAAKRLEDKNPDTDFIRAKAALNRALNRINAVQKK